MGKIAGRNARLYVAVASGALASPLVAIKSFTLSGESERYDSTSFGDTSKTYVAGLPDSSGSFSGFYDSTDSGTFTAAGDGVARSWYFYPSTTNTGQYWFGTGYFDYSISADVGGVIEVSGNFSAATSTAKVG